MRTTATMLALGLLAGTLSAQDGPVTIKYKQLAAGDRVKESKTDKADNTVMIAIMGQNHMQHEKVDLKFVYTDEIIEKPAGAKQPTKLKRTYEVAEMTDGSSDDPKKAELGLAGKTVLIEKGAGGYTFTVDGKPVGEKAAAVLAKEFGKDKQVSEEDFLPKDPVKVGGSWKVDITKLAKDAAGELDIDAAKSSATGKLLKVYEKGGHKFGQIEVAIDLALNKIGPEGKQIDLKPGAKLSIAATLDLCIDGSMWAVGGKMTTTGKFEGTAMGADLKFDLKSVREGSGEEVGRK